jgi:hypothetical protein
MQLAANVERVIAVALQRALLVGKDEHCMRAARTRASRVVLVLRVVLYLPC